jgi:hypothetical protein
MRHPLESVSGRHRRPLFATLLILTVIVIGGMQSVSGPLTTEAAPAGIISYEFARDATTAEEIIHSWDALTKVRAGFNLGLDYLFLVLYSTAIGCACAWIAGALRDSVRSLATVGTLLAWGQWLAGLLDAVENYSLLTMLFDIPTSPWPQIAWGCAVVKFSLVFLGLLYAVAGGVWWIKNGIEAI